jgi:Asp-tRNA(Asn)/Glu-tRNA(Gln) amidotransferase A subunit family amidase
LTQEWAKELDSLPEVKGPLHGVPICIKDDFNVEGMDTTHGYAKRLYNPAPDSAVVVKILQDLGAVPFCKTNVPQTLFTYAEYSHTCKTFRV